MNFAVSRKLCWCAAKITSRGFCAGSLKMFVLEYHYIENMLEKRTPFRAAHLDYANKFVANKILLAGGALVPDVMRGVLLLRTKDIEEVKAFANNDPYVKHGLVKRFDVTEWAIAVGGV